VPRALPNLHRHLWEAAPEEPTPSKNCDLNGEWGKTTRRRTPSDYQRATLCALKARHTPLVLLPVKSIAELIVELGRRPVEAIESCEAE